MCLMKVKCVEALQVLFKEYSLPGPSGRVCMEALVVNVVSRVRVLDRCLPPLLQPTFLSVQLKLLEPTTPGRNGLPK